MVKKLTPALLILLVGGAILNKKNSPFLASPETSNQQVTSAPTQLTSTMPAALTELKPLAAKEISSAQKIKTLEEIINSRNDNDPRLDTELKNLNEEEKDLLINKYYSQKKEALNERGLLIFLVGRNATSFKDINFLKNVLSEPSCKSFEHCEQTYDGEKDEHAAADAITLVYPQLVALTALKNILNSENSLTNIKPLVQEIIGSAAQSQNEKIRSFAENIISEIL